MVIFFSVLLILFVTVIIFITCSTLVINIKELIVINKKLEKFKVIISINLFNKFKWLKLTLDNKKIENSAKLKTLNKILDTKVLRKYKNTKYILIKDWKHVLINLNNVKIDNINIKSKISTKNAATTAISIGIISGILCFILARKTSNLKYNVEPMYINKNYLYLSINCIITVNLVHIISMNRNLGKGVYQKYGRASNRRSYANCNG